MSELSIHRPCRDGIRRLGSVCRVRILLPPSEAKRVGGRGRPLSDRLGADALEGPRRAALHALDALVRGSRERAAEALLLPPATVDDALRDNRNVLHAATMPALRRYAGTVYAGLAFTELSAPERRLAARSTLIFSGLFGVLRGDEPVPAYRVPAKATLPGIGIAATYWRPVLRAAMPALLDTELIVDLRSSDYAAMWRATGAEAERTVAVRMLSPLPRGGLGVVSYPSKLAKGRLAAALVACRHRGGALRDASDVAACWIESVAPEGAGAGGTAGGGAGGADVRVSQRPGGGQLVELITG